MSALRRRPWRAYVAIGATALLLALGAAWLTLPAPPAPSSAPPPPIAQAEAAATRAALARPAGRTRPLIAVVGLNDATELTDYLSTYGLLKRADVADVLALGTAPGPVRLYPALTVEPDATVAEFDLLHPEGADYVIVPAMSRNDDATVLSWLRAQAGKGATVIGVCAGATVVGAAGLLEGKRGTTHWYFLNELRRIEPTLQYVADRRFVVEGAVATTTGITASLPAMLTLVEAIAGHAKAAELARRAGAAHWDARHDSSAFGLNRRFAATVLKNRLAVWQHESLGLALTPGMDEVSLALAADAWSRTYRSRVRTHAAAPVPTLSGLRVVPDATPPGPAVAWTLPTIDSRPPVRVLDDALSGIASRYGEDTADLVAMQLEYAR